MESRGDPKMMLSILISNITTIDVQAWKRGKKPFREKIAKPKLWIALDNNISHTHVWKLPIVTCICILNTCHNNLTTSSAPSCGYQCQKYSILSFYHNNWKGWNKSTSGNMHIHVTISL
jgi:hypothetical protein